MSKNSKTLRNYLQWFC